jgi:rfaE bifunctional protein nucleotidyltransferase chain/domain
MALHLARQKVVDRAELVRWVDAARGRGERVVLTNGCFDLLHLGHVRYLEQAAALGDLLVVGVNADASGRALKGAGRPLVSQAERAEVLAALAAVDLVTIFAEPTAEALVEAVRPDVYVKGGDYRLDELPEAGLARALGGEARVLGLEPGHSTSALVEAIRRGGRAPA